MTFKYIFRIIQYIWEDTAVKTRSVYCCYTIYKKLYDDARLRCNFIVYNKDHTMGKYFVYKGIEFVHDDDILLEFDSEKYSEDQSDWTIDLPENVVVDEDKLKGHYVSPIATEMMREELEELEIDFEQLTREYEEFIKENETIVENKKCECGLAAIGDGLPSSRHLPKCPAYIEE